MVSMEIQYDGNKKCTLTHGPSGTAIRTDAPKDIGGGESAFSPTDLVGAALGACIATTMAMFGERHEMDLTGISVHVTKEMTTSGQRRIARLASTVTIPAGAIPVEQRAMLERVAHSCPIHASLHPEVDAPITFVYAP